MVTCNPLSFLQKCTPFSAPLTLNYNDSTAWASSSFPSLHTPQETVVQGGSASLVLLSQIKDRTPCIK